MNFNKEVYELLDFTRIEELKTDGYLLKHKKSGARIAIMANDDENKVFSIGFRTPPQDSTGVAHILEHSVLCGSAKYPAKDPFIELVKGSLNTFLNAMTYSDKTVYPIASCNDADFKNIMDVYMDAVLHPNIYSRKEIFMQEGWHYEMEDENAPLKYNGVVYNEMKGAFSSPDDVLERYCQNSLYPDTAYSTESGGDPECIPDLSYEQFLEFHKKLYHPSNSYIYIYGNCDMSERLEYLDREYLSSYDMLDVDSEIGFQKPFDKMRRTEADYSVTEEEGTQGKTYLAYNVSIGDTLDRNLYLAFRVIEYALFSAPGAPVKQALTEAGIGDEISSSYDNGIKQPVLSVVSKNTDKERAQEFLDVIMNTLKEQVKNKINRNTLRAGINALEFRYREADFGRWPKGLMYGLDMYDSWLYDETAPFIHLSQNDTYQFLKDNVDTGYFEELVEKYIINNTHSSLVILNPVVGLTEERDRLVEEKLAAYKATLSKTEIADIVKATKALKQYQTEPSTDEELEKIPLLSREDISPEIVPLYNDLKDVQGALVDHHDIYTNGIGYMMLSFDIKNVATCDIPYVGLLTLIMGYIDTKNYTYEEFSNETDIHTGGIFPDFNTYQKLENPDSVDARFNVKCKTLYNEFEKAFELIREMIFDSKYEDTKRIREIIAEAKSRLQGKLLNSGHATAINECFSQMSASSKYTSLTSGLEFYGFLDDVLEDYDNRKDEISQKLRLITEQIFTTENLKVSFTGDTKGYECALPLLEDFIKNLPEYEGGEADRHFEFGRHNVGYKSASQVNYIARCGNFMKKGLPYDASLMVLKTILGYDYLWNNVRVKGGAYGCMTGFFNSGAGYFASYRDPNVKATNEIYENVPEYIENFTPDEREMTKYIIGTFSEIDIPLTPSTKGLRSFECLLKGVDEQYLKDNRMRVLSTTAEDIRKLAPYAKAVLEDGYVCAVGSSEKITEDKELFDEIKNLF